MASINFNNLKNNTNESDTYIYSDLYLDLSQAPAETKFNKNKRTKKNDIKMSYDDDAIKNSLYNLFNTLPGNRILLPDYGCDLNFYVFEHINETNARMIGRSIKNAIEKWENRVSILNIDIACNEAEQLYEITLKLNIVFSYTTNNIMEVRGIMNQQGFITV